MQLLEGAEERETILCNKSTESHESDMDRTFLFVGEVFARICRRGSAGYLKLLNPFCFSRCHSSFSIFYELLRKSGIPEIELKKELLIEFKCL